MDNWNLYLRESPLYEYMLQRKVSNLGVFSIDVCEFTWICGPEDDPEDLCLHGHVTVQIGKTTMEYDGTVSATALYLLKTLTEDKVMSEWVAQRGSEMV